MKYVGRHGQHESMAFYGFSQHTQKGGALVDGNKSSRTYDLVGKTRKVVLLPQEPFLYLVAKRGKKGRTLKTHNQCCLYALFTLQRKEKH
jgi:hypothetical protein